MNEIQNIELISDPYTIYMQKNAQLQIIHCNQTFLKYAGCKSEAEVIGKTDEDFNWRVFAPAYKKQDLDALQGNYYSYIVPLLDYKNELFLFSSWRFIDINPADNTVELHCFLSQLILPAEFSSQAQDLQQITRREAQCLFYLIKGASASKIANELHISPKTVETHIVNLKKKFHSRTREELIKALIDNGLFQLLTLVN